MVEKKEIKAVIFDLNNVVIIDAPWHAITNAALRKGEDRENFHYRIHTKNIRNDIWWKLTTGRISEKEFWRELDRNIRNLKVLTKMKQELYSFLIPKKKTIEIIKSLKRRYKTGLLTNFSKEWMNIFKEKQENKGIINLFDEVVNSADVGIKKPDKRIYEIMLRRLDLKSGEALFVDDREKNMATAREAGMIPVLYKSAVQLERDLEIFGIDL